MRRQLLEAAFLLLLLLTSGCRNQTDKNVTEIINSTFSLHIPLSLQPEKQSSDADSEGLQIWAKYVFDHLEYERFMDGLGDHDNFVECDIAGGSLPVRGNPSWWRTDLMRFGEIAIFSVEGKRGKNPTLILNRGKDEKGRYLVYLNVLLPD